MEEEGVNWGVGGNSFVLVQTVDKGCPSPNRAKGGVIGAVHGDGFKFLRVLLVFKGDSDSLGLRDAGAGVSDGGVAVAESDVAEAEQFGFGRFATGSGGVFTGAHGKKPCTSDKLGNGSVLRGARMFVKFPDHTGGDGFLV